jgi:hypothetical protein
LRDLNPSEVKARLIAATKQLRLSPEPKTLVVDDLDTVSDPRSIEGALGALWRCQKKLGGKLVVTADRQLPPRLAQAIELDASREFQILDLSRFCAAPSARLSHLAFESDGAFPTQC